MEIKKESNRNGAKEYNEWKKNVMENINNKLDQAEERICELEENKRTREYTD